MRILITDSDTRSALAATRSLARRGDTIVTAGERHRSLAAVSRHSSAFVHYPQPTDDPDGFVAAVSSAIETHSIDVAMPMTEITTRLLAENRSRLPSRCRLPLADAHAIACASDKQRVLELARELGVPAPITLVVNSMEELATSTTDLRFPLVIKPTRSRVRTTGGWISTKVSYAFSATDLNATLTRLHPAAFPVLLQERIYGPGVGVFACYEGGKPVAFFSHRRIREKPPSGGVSVLSESIPLDPTALDYARRLLDRLSWHGVAMVEFKQDSHEQCLKLMEINARFWGSLQLAINAGIDFPSLAVDVAVGRSPPHVAGYKTGVRNRWLLGDADVLLTVLTTPRERLSLPQGFPSKARLLMDFLHFWGSNLHYEVLSLSDPRPAMFELRQWLTRR